MGWSAVETRGAGTAKTRRTIHSVNNPGGFNGSSQHRLKSNNRNLRKITIANLKSMIYAKIAHDVFVIAKF
jgi:hypothetical protein